MKKLFLIFSLVAFWLPRASLAEVYQDQQTKVNYAYMVGDTASGSVTTENDSVAGDVTVLSHFVVDGIEYEVTAIGEQAFSNCSEMTAITIPNSVKTIGTFAFGGCQRLKSVNFPETMESIGMGAFVACDSLTVIELPQGLKKLEDATFEGCRNLEKVVLPEGLEAIGDHAFNGGLYNLTEVNFPTSLVSVGAWAFSNCSGLTSLFVSKDLVEIGQSAFYGCGFKSIIVEEGNPKYDSRNQCNAIIETGTNTLLTGSSSTIIPQGIEKIAGYAFAGCKMENLNIPESVKEVGPNAFQECVNLKKISLPEGIASIGDYTFSVCRSLLEIDIPSSVTTIGLGAFSTCSDLKEIVIPQRVTKIGSSAFQGCRNLTQISLPKGLVSIGDRAFYDCGNLEEIIIPEGITSIPDYLFLCCYKLRSITIPSTVKSFGYWAFQGCTALASIISFIRNPSYFYAPALGSDSYTRFGQITLYVPKGTKSSYQSVNATGWNQFKNIVEFEDRINQQEWQKLQAMHQSLGGAKSLPQWDFSAQFTFSVDTLMHRTIRISCTNDT